MRAIALFCLLIPTTVADEPRVVSTEFQPLQAGVKRLTEAFEYLGHPVAAKTSAALNAAVAKEDSIAVQKALDASALFVVSINPELRVKVARGAADPILQQAGYTPVLIKVINESTVTRRLRMDSPQAGPIYAGAAEGILKRQAQTELRENENTDRERRFLNVEVFESAPMTSRLSGAKVEYLIGLIYCSEAGQREATIVFDIGQGTQDLGFRSQVPVLFTVRPALPVKMRIRDFDGKPTTAKLEFRDQDGRVYPPQARRLAPDFFFQPHIYRDDGDVVLLPPGKFQLQSGRGPEYVTTRQNVEIKAATQNTVSVQLKRWVNPAAFGYYSGDHHIHGAGCSHYDNPTQGVTPQDMFAQVKGEGLNVGCVLTWGPCYDHQRNYFSPIADTVSEPLTVLKYDLEISGFGSAALGHVCLLNLRDQTFPGSEGTSTRGWPKWTVPVMRWAKEQNGVTGYPHSALHVDPRQAAAWQIRHFDSDGDQTLSADEVKTILLAETFSTVDEDGDQKLTARELESSASRAADTIPNTALPSMNGGGAMEIFVSTSEGVCDFISAMDTARIPEWNTWYHLLNCGFPLKLSGETDFPCMSSRRVGQGRVYVQLGEQEQIDFTKWCQGIAAGRSYVSDGFAHALQFKVNGTAPGTQPLQLTESAKVQVSTRVAFAEVQPKGVAYGTITPSAGLRMSGDTVNLHAPRDSGMTTGGRRRVELIVNGLVRAHQDVPADGEIHDLGFDVQIDQSSWVAIRQFPQLHTNPVTILLNDKPIRASRASALWCAESVRLLWHNRRRFIAESERPEARKAYDAALARYYQIGHEAGPAVPAAQRRGLVE